MLKILAVVFMVVDHCGYFFFPHLPVLRLIGRSAFPLFALLIGVNFLRSSDPLFYWFRLFVLGLICYPLCILVFHWPFYHLDILFTLSFGLGLCLCWSYPLTFSVPFNTRVLLSVLLLCLAPFCSYGLAGVLLVPLGSLWYLRPRSPLVIGSLLLTLLFVNPPLWAPFALPALPLFWFFTFGPGRSLDRSLSFLVPSRFFYAFYPSHLVFLYGLVCVLA